MPLALVEEIHGPLLVERPAESLSGHGLLACEQREEVGGEGLAIAARFLILRVLADVVQ